MNYRHGGVADWPAISGMLSTSDYYDPTDVSQLGGRWLVAEHSNQLVGCVWVFSDGHNAYIDYLYVTPRFRKTVVPAKLVAHLHQLLKNTGVKRAYGVIRSDNADAKRLMEGFGTLTDDGYTLAFKEL
jgi:GNAT superfamily N-acetyltransferase